MPDKPQKTLEQITQDVLASTFNQLSDSDLDVIFSNGESGAPTEPTANIAQPQPAAAIAGQGPSTATPSPTVTPEVRETPVAAPVVPAAGAVSKAEDRSSFESVIQEQQSKISRLEQILQDIADREEAAKQSALRAQAATAITKEEAEIDDSAIIENPKENIMKMIRGELMRTVPLAFQEYDNWANKRTFMDQFRNSHADFDELKNDMRIVVAEDPQNRSDPYMLPRVYEEAKRRRAARGETVRKDAGIDMGALEKNISNIVTSQITQVLDGIKKRRNAAGTVTGGEPVKPGERQTSQPQTKELTFEEQTLQDMLESGPQSLTHRFK